MFASRPTVPAAQVKLAPARKNRAAAVDASQAADVVEMHND